MFLSSELRGAIVGDLQERYGQTFKQRGRNLGTLWFWLQITTSFAHFTWAALKANLRPGSNLQKDWAVIYYRQHVCPSVSMPISESMCG
jgi:hypothetical protein